MRGVHNIWRLIRTGATFERTGAMRQVLEAVEAPRGVRIVARVLGYPFKLLGYTGDPSMPPVPRALTALGPAYIKFGQILSTRPDVVGSELAQQLRVLQDKLPPFSVEIAKKTIEAELERPIGDMFSEFSEPIAAASLAQVHKARLEATGEWVAVKVLRPGIERSFIRDVDAFYLAANMVEIFAPFARRLRPMDVIRHFEGVVRGELDLRLESASASEFAANTEKDDGFHVPEVIALDFGIMGYIDEYTRRVYAEILFGFIRRDYHRVAQVHFEAGYVPATQDVEEFARALRAVGEPIFGMDATQISMGRLLNHLFEVTERFGMETRTELILLQRTMVVVEGVARSLDPRINIWQVAKPVVEGYIRDSIGPLAVLNDLKNTLAVVARFGPRLPGIVEQALMKQATAGGAPEKKSKRPLIFGALLAIIGAGLGAAIALNL
ncbi:MAG: 2-polyprenylphenol 6-hydroxylase [Rhodobacteraceae bacterium]|nr:2-polyprenylphenol 6-hydroxylase [Paracoccaceae bacterium]